MKTDDKNLNSKKLNNVNLPNNLKYPSSEDIYNQNHKESEIDPEDITKKKSFDKPDTFNKNNAKDFKDAMSGSDLDVPGSELDDEQEDIASEDEENNYYSLGGDDHNDLEEDKGE